MTGRIIALGDVHGCLQALDAVLEVMAVDAGDTLVALGDYVDRGPDSRGVIERMLRLREECRLVPLLGNHDQMFLDVIRGGDPQHWLPHGGAATLDSYGFQGDLACVPAEHVAFLESLAPYWETEDFLFTHANYDPRLPMSEQPAELLRWTNLRQHLPGPHVSGKTVIVGHTANREGEVLDLGYVKCLDTCCYGGRWLTAMDVESETIWQADPAGRLRTS